MAKLTRKDVKLFAENCKPTLTTEFRTESADGSTASFSRDPDVIQNANFGQGWVDDDNNLNVKIFTEDLNSVCYVFSYFLKYLYENGIPEWKSTTTYYEHSIARVDNKLYISLQDDNLNYDPQNTSGYWNEVPLETITTALAGNGSNIVKSLSGNHITFKSLSVDGYGSLQDDGDQINIHILGGSGVVDAFWGQIQGTLTNQTDLVTALGNKQDNLTFATPLSVDVNNEVSIPKATSAINGYLDATDFATFAGKQDALSFSSPLSVNSNNEVSISTASTNSSGILSSSDWNTFNGKQSTVSATSPLSITSNNISIGQAGISTSGYLSSSDWNTFNGKQGTITANSPLSLSSNTLSIQKASATQSGYLDKDNFSTFNNKVSANNSTITIQLNGSNVDSFTTNASSNKTINIANVIKSDGNYLSTQEIRTDLITENITPRNVGQTCQLGSSNKPWNILYVKYVDLSDGNSYGVVCKDAAGNKQSGYYCWMGKGGRLYVNGTEVGGCDRKIKSEIKDLNFGLETLLQLTPVSFKRKNDEDTRAGFIAQDLLGVYDLAVLKPDCEGGTYGLDQLSLIALQTKAIQELSEKVEKLETRIEVLEKGNKELEK